MSGHDQNITEILISRKAAKARGLVILPVLVGCDWRQLAATPATWSGVVEQLAAAGVAMPGSATEQVENRVSFSSHDERARLMRLYQEYRDSSITAKAISRREGIPYWRLSRCFRNFADEAYRATAAKAPITKPSGGIL